VLLRVAIADDGYRLREALRELLADAQDVEIVAVCQDGKSLLAAIERESPDVVLCEIRMAPYRDREGIQIAAQLRETHPEIGVVILSDYQDPGLALELIHSGSAGRAYLIKERVRPSRTRSGDRGGRDRSIGD
jgi:DNA-binding NarL/FixJ family response regulator